MVKLEKGFWIFRFKFNQGFRFDMYTWCYLSEYTNMTFDELGNIDNSIYVSKLLYSAATSYNKDKGIKIKFTESNVKIWIEDMKQKTLNSLIQCMLDSKIGGESIVNLYKKSKSNKKKVSQ